MSGPILGYLYMQRRLSRELGEARREVVLNDLIETLTKAHERPFNIEDVEQLGNKGFLLAQSNLTAMRVRMDRGQLEVIISARMKKGHAITRELVRYSIIGLPLSVVQMRGRMRPEFLTYQEIVTDNSYMPLYAEVITGKFVWKGTCAFRF